MSENGSLPVSADNRRSKAPRTLIHGIRPGGFVVWLDEVPPPYRKDWPIKQEAVIGLVTSAGHRTRTLFIYRKTDAAYCAAALGGSSGVPSRRHRRQNAQIGQQVLRERSQGPRSQRGIAHSRAVRADEI